MASIDSEIKTQFANYKHRLLVNVIFTSSWLRNKYAEGLKPFGISNQQMNILRILRGAKDWLAMNEIKNRMVEKSPNSTRLADKLLDKGLVNRERCQEDRRVVFLKITQEGLNLLDQIQAKEDEKPFLDVLDKVTEEEAKIVCDILDKLRD